MKEITGMENTQQYGFELSKENIQKLTDYFQENREKIHKTFGMRDRIKSDKLDTKNSVKITNKVLEKFAYSKIKRGKQERKRINGKQVDVSSYEVVGNKNNNLNIYKHIKGKRRRVVEEPLRHPLLRRGDTEKVINAEELEDVRLKSG